jgi:hypothetical protein
MRVDLLQLTQEDLELFSNRGTVRRASAECEAGDPPLNSIEEAAGTIAFDWQDSCRCTIPAGKSLNEATCTCSATGICRHIVRSVLAYQATHSRARENDQWWPGAISDTVLTDAFKPAILKRARELVEQGQLVRLTCGRRPVARFISLAHTVRFIVPDNVQYAVCDCRDQQPCMHVAMAVMCFRLTTANIAQITIETGHRVKFEAAGWITKLEEALTSLISTGFASSSASETLRRLQQLIIEATDTGSFFIAELLDEIIESRDQQLRGDAQFSPEKLAALLGELLCRLDAAQTKSDERTVPVNLLLGGKWNAPSLIKTANMTALGSIVSDSRQAVEIAVYALEKRSGEIVSIVKTVANQPGDDQPSFQKLSQRMIAGTVSLATLAASNVIVKNSKMTASREIKLSNSQLSTSPQDYSWNLLNPSIYFEDLNELQLSLNTEFPSYLSQRTASSALRVLKVAETGLASFRYENQNVDTTLLDASGNACHMALQYRSRGSEGFELTLKLLNDPAYKLIYVAGLWTLQNGLTVRPAGLIFEVGGERIMLQPDIGFVRGLSEQPTVVPEGQHVDMLSDQLEPSFASFDPYDLPITECMRTLGQLMVKGILRGGPIDLRQLAMLQQQCEAGHSRLLGPAIDSYIDSCALHDAQPQDLDKARKNVCERFKRFLVVTFLLSSERHLPSS